MGLLNKNDSKSLTIVCGKYCAVFLLHFHRFKDLRCFLSMFNCELLENDPLILKFVEKSYQLKLPLFIAEL